MTSETDKHNRASADLLDGLGVALRDAIIVALGCAVVAVGINGLAHPEGIPLVAAKAYETLVPCPVPGGAVEPVDADSTLVDDEATFVVDARLGAEFGRWHLPRAVNINYDYLDPTPPSVIRELSSDIARSRAQRVVVYGDGDDPDTGRLLAKEIAGQGIRNVVFVRGGAPALRRGGSP